MAKITPVQAAGRNVVDFLDLIAFSEGTSTHPLTKCDGYDVIVTGEDAMGKPVHLEVFTEFADHPFANGRPGKIVREGPPVLRSTASGRYQVLHVYFEDYRAKLHLDDFSPLSQDHVAIQQIQERRAASAPGTPAFPNALALVMRGDNASVVGAIVLCSNIWASFPGNAYGQGGRTLTDLMAKWHELQARPDEELG